MPTTLVQPLPYPAPGVVPDVPADLKLLAEAVETRGVMRFPSIAARDAALPVGQRIAGMMAYVEADATLYIYSVGKWQRAWSGGGWKPLGALEGWTVVNAVEYALVGDDLIMRGIVQRTGAGGAVDLMTMPVGTRPAGQNPVLPVASTNASPVRATITTAGLVTITPVATGDYVYLNNIRYRLV